LRYCILQPLRAKSNRFQKQNEITLQIKKTMTSRKLFKFILIFDKIQTKKHHFTLTDINYQID